MKKTLSYFSILIVVIGIFYSCKKEAPKETYISGETVIYTDESLQPILEDQISVFENSYSAKLNLISKSESEIINLMINDSIRLAVLTRMLNKDEEITFSQKGITPIITRFGLDAVVFITNKNSNDSLIELERIVKHLKGEEKLGKELVFDNPNSGAIRLLFDKAQISRENQTIYSKSSPAELIKYISENEDFIGVIGINWLTQTPNELQQYTENLKILHVQNVKTDSSDTEYYYPSQANIAKKSYPLTREIYLLNYQGKDGLGMGFASFVASDIGQKIVLTSGLAPMKLEQLKINIIK